MKNKDLSKITVKLPCKMLEVLKKIEQNIESNSKFCPNCGVSNQDNNKYCPECGADLT